MAGGKFATPEGAIEQVQTARQTGRLPAALGLARVAINQFPASSALQDLLAELYSETHQHAQARSARAQAQQLAGREAPDAPAGPLAPSPAATLFAALLPARAPAGPPPIPPIAPEHHRELLANIDALVVELVGLETELAGRGRSYDAVKETVGECRQSLRGDQGLLRLSIGAQQPAAPVDVPFTLTLGPREHESGLVNQGPQVLALQKVLNHERLAVPYTSAYDPTTHRAVYKLQEKYGLARSGIVDEPTRSLLTRLVAQRGARLKKEP